MEDCSKQVVQLQQPARRAERPPREGNCRCTHDRSGDLKGPLSRSFVLLCHFGETVINSPNWPVIISI